MWGRPQKGQAAQVVEGGALQLKLEQVFGLAPEE